MELEACFFVKLMSLNLIVVDTIGHNFLRITTFFTGYAIVQCAGDTVFIPAGACHQVDIELKHECRRFVCLLIPLLCVCRSATFIAASKLPKILCLQKIYDIVCT